MLTPYLQKVVKTVRATKPTVADQQRNPGIDLMALHKEDIEHTIKCQRLAGEQAEEFLAACLDGVAA